MLNPDKNSSHSSAAKVGIFMPCYNMGDYFDESLKSLDDQTFQDFIVIIADDASPIMKTRDKLATIKRMNYQIYFEKNNLGLVKISNKYINKLDTEYVLLYSPDDKLHPDFLREQVEYLDKHSDIQAVCTWIQEFDEGNNIIKYNDGLCKLPYMLVENHFSGAALIRKSAWLAAGKYDANINLYPNLDYDLWLSMLEKDFTLGTIPKPLFYWRVKRNSLSHRMGHKQLLIFRKALLKKYASLYRKYADFVLYHNLETISKFEEYYFESEVGHEWLDRQYKQLTQQTFELSSRLEDSIEKPYLRSAYFMFKKRKKQ